MKPLFTVFLLLSGTLAVAQEPVLLNDFSTGGASTFTFDPEIEGITTSNQLFFIADDGKHGEELWRSNGTAVGTQLLKDINPNEANSGIRLFAAIGNTVYFAANDVEHGYELWTTQGTTSSSQLVKDLNPGPGGSTTNQFAVLNDVFYFSANGDKGTELYRSEGTENTTSLVRDINSNVSNSGLPFGSSPNKFTTAENNIYFVANDGEHGNELWKTDGTFGGTTLVRDIREGSNSTSFGQFKTFGNTLVFTANDGIHGNELWISLGSEATTFMVKDITEGGESSTIEILEVVNDILYFTVRESVFRRLWKTDGTEEGTTQVLNQSGNAINVRGFVRYKEQLIYNSGDLWAADGDTIRQVTQGVSAEGEFAIVNDVLYFVASEGSGGNGLWKTDGTPEGTSLVKEITTASYKYIDHLTAGTNHVFFIAEDDEFGRELWASNGTEEGTFMLVDSKPGTEDGFRSYEDVTFHLLGDKILFAGFDEAHGRELWASDGTIEGTALVKDINTQSEDIQLYNNPIPYKDDVYFGTEAGIWKTDDSAENTVLFQESSSVFGINVFNEKLIYTAPAPGINRTIWTSDGTAEGTQPLIDSASVVEGNLLFIFQQNLPQINGTMYFSGRDSEHGSELWKTDGTAVGTTMVKDINTGTDDSFYSFSSGDYIVMNDILYFVAADNLLGAELWKTDGTEAATVPVSDINPFGSSSPSSFTEVDGTIFFSANDGTGGYELWKTNGTTEGTVLVKDIFPGEENGVRFSEFVNFQGTLFFSADDGEHGKELWKTDGTEEGTVLVKDIYPKTNNFTRSSNPRNFFVDGDAFYFVAQDSTGTKLWKSDGTTEGTQPFLELEASFNTQLVNANGTLFFTVTDEEHGEELWKTNGTPEGTRLVHDIVPGSRDSSPILLGYINDALYFTADDDVNGRELWTLAPLSMQTALTASQTEICTPGETITFTAAATDAGADPKYVWYANDQLVENQNSTTFTTTSLTGGDAVKVQVIADEEVWVLQDSIFSETITISFSSLNPKITIAGNKLTASEGTSYQWFLNGEPLPDTTRSIEALESGNYQVEIKNKDGCSFLSDEVEVIVCDIETPTIQVEGFTLTVNTAGKYRWFFDGELLADTIQSIKITKSGNYQVEVTNAQGCAVLSETATIDVCSNLTATIQIEGTTLTANEGVAYQWFFNGNLLSDTTQTIEAEESGIYQVEITDSLGCTALSGEVEVAVCTDFSVTLTQEGAVLTTSEGAAYRWFLDGELLLDDTQSIATQQSGTYQVEVTNAQGCVTLSEEVAITVTGVEDELLARQLRIYPNPAASRLLIDSQMHEEVKVFIYNTSGKKVLESTLSPQREGYEISLHHLTPGLYLVRFIGEKGAHQKKLIKY